MIENKRKIFKAFIRQLSKFKDIKTHLEQIIVKNYDNFKFSKADKFKLSSFGFLAPTNKEVTLG